MIAGRRSPELGGRPDYLDIIGVNYYPANQWFSGGRTLGISHPQHRPLRDLLLEVQRRYDHPLLIAETGTEGEGRASWLRHVAGEVAAAADAGVRIEGICLYPILDYPGWRNGRHCRCGLLGPPDRQGVRPVYQPLARELGFQRDLKRWPA
jgi:hypothetical protein